MPRSLRVLVMLTCLMLVGGLGVGATTAPAAASSTRLCLGYDACRALGMPNAGYRANSGTMWWRMYAGHNCTNYAAYRMVRSGLPNIRPWLGGGNAMYWGTANPGLTNALPRVGAVAWWKANVPGAGSSGHVAYVEQVVSADEIVVSEDSWGGDFSWRRITRDDTGWPSGFVHFNDTRLRSTAPPTVSGTPEVGGVLTASAGSWRPAAATYRYQWRADGVPITGATGPSLTMGPGQEGRQISVRVTAARLGYLNGTAFSSGTAAVEPTVLTSTTAPTITGDATVDSTLTASPGSWAPAPTALAYQWLADGAPVPGATRRRLTPGPDLVGTTLAVAVTASRDGFADSSVESVPTGPVEPGTLTATRAPAVTGIPRPGETLRLDPGAFTPADAEVSVQWRRAGVQVEGATGATYPLSHADLGARITARVTATSPGYTTLSARTPATPRVRSAPVLRVRTAPGRRRLGVTVGVTASAVRPVPGTVRVWSRGRLLKDLTLRDGAAAATLTGLPAGGRSFTFRYRASQKVSATAVTRTVRIS